MKEIRFSLFQSIKQSEQKFDYFIAGLVGTTFAYSVQQFEWRGVNCGLGLLEPVALCLLLLCLWFSMKKIEKAIALADLNHEILEHKENADMYHRMQNEKETMNIDTGELLTRTDLKDRMRESQQKVVQKRAEGDRAAAPIRRYEKLRTAFLVLAFVALLVSKFQPKSEKESNQSAYDNDLPASHSSHA
ncbi:hypothetical protein [Cerasicoccus arenae]|uniref:Uncharacterized protein n=1 Tax=Cerasicoccus arenae TaxID=424488 RepID=A0A8J3GEE3_9BACT|nr:hypothetical protein [Cerasicoccus arenae]MBK1859556.1 hypothetical protein [Cerasicoccus arenae]GHC03144.1 hypothetical protein GCM10007047_19620 [Cerasicoccus arenae]